MLEIFGSIAASEVGKFVWEKGLELGQAAAEDYVKDFFKDALKGELGAKPEVAKKAVGEALKAFLGLVVEELEDCEVSPAEIRNGYEKPLMAFVKDAVVKPILGGAFERECKAIDTVTLSQVWARSEYKKKPFPEMPERFDWERVGKEYLKKVRKIVRSSEELRSLLQTELLEAIANQQVSPGFEVDRYREVLRCSYGVLKLSTIDSTDQQYRMRLWNVFVEQTVREALPPSRYELPIDVRREIGMTGDLDGEALEGYRREYLQQPARKVLEAIGGVAEARSPLAPLGKGGTGDGDGEKGSAVILGDPGAGKSTVLQYLAIEWAEGRSTVLPLLIELREYALWGAAGFLEFLHGGRGADWCFDRVQLDAYLRENPTLVMLDGLDEVFERSMQAAIVDEMIRFSHQYPKARILVTSRVVGYNPDRLQNAGFRHFTIQSLESDEIHEFIDKWYDLAMPGDDDRERLKQRLKDAIANSKAIGNLADNLLLLTMMVILNRRQELPRDRSELYEQATRVLLHHWDVDHKSLQLPMEAIGRREKQAMLRCVAYEMQTSEAGLKGNLITAERLTQVLTGYLREQGFEAPREKANGLIEQLRSRNWILCDRGADTYGFVHRTFLEYFCAMEIVHRFEKTRSLTFEQLRDEVFGNHWQDETWHEVLRLICGAIDPHFSGDLITSLMEVEIDKSDFLEEVIWRFPNESRHYLKKEGIDNLILAIECLNEIENRSIISIVEEKLLHQLQFELEVEGVNTTSDTNSSSENHYSLSQNASRSILSAISNTWKGDLNVYNWIKSLIRYRQKSYIPAVSLRAIVKGWREEEEETLSTIYKIIKSSGEFIPVITFIAIEELAREWRHLPTTYTTLVELSQDNKNPNPQQAAIKELAKGWTNVLDVLNLLKTISQSENTYFGVRSEAITELADRWTYEPWMFNFLCDCAISDPFVRGHESQRNPRLRALQALCSHYPTHPKTIELLHDRALNDPDEQLREWAQGELRMRNLE